MFNIASENNIFEILEEMVTCRMILRRARGCGLKRSFEQIRA